MGDDAGASAMASLLVDKQLSSSLLLEQSVEQLSCSILIFVLNSRSTFNSGRSRSCLASAASRASAAARRSKKSTIPGPCVNACLWTWSLGALGCLWTRWLR